MAIIRIALLLIICIALLINPASALADEASKCTFSGTAELDGAEVADGTLVTAVIEGIEYHTHTPTGYGYSTYSMTIQPPEGKSFPDGTKVAFKINGQPTDQTDIFQAGGNFRLDLTTVLLQTGGNRNTGTTLLNSGQSNIGGSFNWGVTIGFLVAMFAAGAFLYYSILLRRVMKKGLLKQKITSNQVITEKQTASKK